MKEVSVDLGCGREPTRGYLGVDRADLKEIDIRADIVQLPFRDDSINEIVANHVVEHLNKGQFQKFLDEIYRVLKEGGKAEFKTEHPLNPHFWESPDHVRPYGYGAFKKALKGAYKNYLFEMAEFASLDIRFEVGKNPSALGRSLKKMCNQIPSIGNFLSKQKIPIFVERVIILQK